MDCDVMVLQVSIVRFETVLPLGQMLDTDRRTANNRSKGIVRHADGNPKLLLEEERQSLDRGSGSIHHRRGEENWDRR